MILPKLRSNLNVMPSPDPARPGLLIRDLYRYSNAWIVVPPAIVKGLQYFDGVRTDADLIVALSRDAGQADMTGPGRQLIEALSQAGFLENEFYLRLRETRHKEFALSPVREPAHAGSEYPDKIDPLHDMMRPFLEGRGPGQPGIKGIAAPHVSLRGGWNSYRAAYHMLTPDLKDRTFVILGTSHYGPVNKFGLTRKPFKTPYGTTGTDNQLLDALADQPAVLMEDYCHAIEHSIELQVLFLQALYGADVKILPVLCGPYIDSIRNGGLPEKDEGVRRFLGTFADIAAREEKRLIWILGVDMAHMGLRYNDSFSAHADRDEMAVVKQRDTSRIARILAGDARGFWDQVQDNHDDLKWCGSSPFYTFMKVKPQVLGTLQRYEQWNIDEQSVVSFAGISFAA